MQVVILAGGQGTRLRPLTNEIPKAMVKVGGKPILEHTLSILPRKIEEVILVVGYKGEQIKNYFGSVWESVKLTYVHQPKPLGTSDALVRTRSLLQSSPFLLLSGDDLYHGDDLEEICERNEPTVLVMRSENPERFGVCFVNRKSRLLKIVEKPENPQSDLVNIGAYLLNHEIFDVPVTESSNGEFYLAEQVGNWARQRSVYAHEAQSWHPINNKEELTAADKFLAREQ